MTNYDKAVAQWRDKSVTTDAELACALGSRSISFAYNSGRLENANVTYNDTREIFEHDGVTSYTGDLRTLFELRNAREANEFLLDAFGKRLPFDETLIKNFQRILTQNTYDARRWQLGERPGEYKRHDYVTGKNEVGAPPEDVEAEVAELLSEMASIREGDALPAEKILTAAAYFHAKLENIHPFADGNGRVGRIAMNYFLLMQNHPPIIIHEEDRKGYYDALEAWDTSGELSPLVEFLREQTVKTWAKK